MEPVCANCRFWEPSPGAGFGYCKAVEGVEHIGKPVSPIAALVRMRPLSGERVQTYARLATEPTYGCVKFVALTQFVPPGDSQ